MHDFVRTSSFVALEFLPAAMLGLVAIGSVLLAVDLAAAGCRALRRNLVMVCIMLVVLGCACVVYLVVTWAESMCIAGLLLAALAWAASWCCVAMLRRPSPAPASPASYDAKDAWKHLRSVWAHQRGSAAAQEGKAHPAWSEIGEHLPSVRFLQKQANNKVNCIRRGELVKGNRSRAKRALASALVTVEWGCTALDIATALRGIEVAEAILDTDMGAAVIRELRGGEGPRRRTRGATSQAGHPGAADTDSGDDLQRMRNYLQWRRDSCLGFHTGVTLLCNLAYAVTEGARDTAVPVGMLRWHVASLLRREEPKLSNLEPGHIKVHEVVDNTFATRAFVCVAHELVPVPDEDADAVPDDDDDPESFVPSDDNSILTHCLLQVGWAEHVKTTTALAAPLQGTDVMWHRAPPDCKWRAVAAVVVFTGTETLSLFATKHIHVGGDDATDGAKLEPSKDGLEGGAHGAWLAMLRGMHGSLAKGLEDANGDLKWLRGPGEVWILGHSMGAALATLAAPFVVQLAKDLPLMRARDPLPTIKLSTIASPRVLNETAVACYSRMGNIRIQRFVLDDDLVPSLPPKCLGFRHIGFERRLRTPRSVSAWSNIFGGTLIAALLAHGVQSYRRPLEEAESAGTGCLSRAYADD